MAELSPARRFLIARERRPVARAVPSPLADRLTFALALACCGLTAIGRLKGWC